MKNLDKLIKVLLVVLLITGCAPKKPDNTDKPNTNQNDITTNDSLNNENNNEDKDESLNQNDEQNDQDIVVNQDQKPTDKPETNKPNNNQQETNKPNNNQTNNNQQNNNQTNNNQNNTNKPTPDVQVEYKLNATKKELTEGDTFTLKVTNYTGSVTWSSSNKTVASVNNGKVTALKKGSAVISATFNNTTLTCQITVNELVVVSNPKLNKTSITLDKGDTYQLKVTDTTSDVTWKALSNGKEDGSIITVTNKGLVKAIAKGNGVVYAIVDGKQLECKVTVKEEVKDDCYEMAREAFNLHNEERAKEGLPKLAWNEELYKGALIRAKECVESFSHTRPNGESCFTVIKTRYAALGENIAYGQKSAKEVVNGWMNSPGHRANILDPDFISMGLACYRDESNGRLYWATFFAGKKL